MRQVTAPWRLHKVMACTLSLFPHTDPHFNKFKKRSTKIKLHQRYSNLKRLQLIKTASGTEKIINVFLHRKFWKQPNWNLIVIKEINSYRSLTLLSSQRSALVLCYLSCSKWHHEMEKVISWEFGFFLQLGAFLVPTTVTWRFLPPASNKTPTSLLLTYMEDQLWNNWSL